MDGLATAGMPRLSGTIYKVGTFCQRIVLISILGLVLPDIPTESDAYREGLTEQVWTELKSEGLDCVKRQAEVYRRIYYGGVEHQLR